MNYSKIEMKILKNTWKLVLIRVILMFINEREANKDQQILVFSSFVKFLRISVTKHDCQLHF